MHVVFPFIWDNPKGWTIEPRRMADGIERVHGRQVSRPQQPSHIGHRPHRSGRRKRDNRKLEEITMDDPHTIDRNETHDMISSEKVDGTAVYGHDGEQIGSVHHLMIGKRDGKVRHAVVSYGGFLGIGEDFFPLPWDELTYDERRGGYVVSRNADQLKAGPRYRRDEEPTWDSAYDNQVMSFFGSR
jgi:sporulation protein YlmC with PRC-barrel domain